MVNWLPHYLVHSLVVETKKKMEIGIELHFGQVEGEDYIRKITMWNLQKKERCKTDTRDKKVNEKPEKEKSM